jgi:hypothetical protein
LETEQRESVRVSEGAREREKKKETERERERERGLSINHYTSSPDHTTHSHTHSVFSDVVGGPCVKEKTIQTERTHLFFRLQIHDGFFRRFVANDIKRFCSCLQCGKNSSMFSLLFGERE